MRTGRPPKWLLERRLPGLIDVDARPLSSQRRLTVPKRLLASMSWHTDGVDSEVCLFVRERGRIVIRSENHLGYARQTWEELKADASEDDEESLITLVSLQLTYLPAVVESNNQIKLPEIAVAFLESSGSPGEYIFIVRLADSLELWSLSKAASLVNS